MWLLGNIRLIGAGIAIIAILGVVWRLDYLSSRVDSLKAENASLTASLTSCNANATFSKESNHALSTRLNLINGAYDRLLEAHRNLPVTRAGGGYSNPSDADESAWGLTATQRKLNDIQAARLIEAQESLCYIYQTNGQPLQECK